MQGVFCNTILIDVETENSVMHLKEAFYLFSNYCTSIQFPSPEWDTVTSAAKELIDGLLDRNQEGRITAETALNCAWVKVCLRGCGLGVVERCGFGEVKNDQRKVCCEE